MLSGTKGPHQIKVTKQIESTKFDQMNTVHRAEGPISQNINFQFSFFKEGVLGSKKLI